MTTFRRLVPALAASILALSMIGCGDDGPTPASTPPADATPAAGSEGTETEAAFTPKNTYTAQLAVDEGQQVDVTIDVGDKFDVDDELPADFASLQTACEIDSQTDVLVPVRITVKNSNERFDASVSPNLKVEDPSQHINLQLAENFDSGASCADSLTSNAQLTVSPGGTTTHDTLVVIGRYYTPANPDGNQDLFESVAATIGGRPLIKNLTCMSGPGSAGGYFSLAGAKIKLDGENGMPEC